MSAHANRVPYVVSGLLIECAEAEALRIAVPMVMAIVDGDGGLQRMARMDDALPASTQLAIDKAYTAAVLRMTSEQVGKLALPGAPLYGIGNTHQGRIILFGGGIPLRWDGEVVGAIGLSGGSVEEDIRVAEAAVSVFDEMVRWEQSISRSLGNGAFNSAAINGVQAQLRNLLGEMIPAVPAERRAAIEGGVWLSLSLPGI